MKKLTLKTLKEIIKKDFIISDFKAIHQENKTIYIIYPFYMAKLVYSDVTQWGVILYGEIMTMNAKKYVQLCDKLEGFYIGEKNGL